MKIAPYPHLQEPYLLCTRKWCNTRHILGSPGVRDGSLTISHSNRLRNRPAALLMLFAWPFQGSFKAWSSNMNIQHKSPGELLRRFLGPRPWDPYAEGWDGTLKFTFWTSIQVMLMLLVWGPHFENQYSQGTRQLPWSAKSNNSFWQD